MDAEKVIYFKEKYFDQRPFVLDDTGVTNRELSHWEEKELLSIQTEPNKWKRLNIVDLAWIRFIAHLRNLNVGLATIKIIKNELLSDVTIELREDILKYAIKSVEEAHPEFKMLNSQRIELEEMIGKMKMSYFESSLYEMLISESPVSVAISIKSTSNGKEIESINNKFFMELIYWDKVIKDDGIHKFLETLSSTCICISLNEILADVFVNISLKKVAQIFNLSNDELKLISEVRKAKYKSITIQFDKKNKPSLILATEVIKETSLAKLLDILSKQEYGNIEAVTVAGKIVNFENTKKIKLQGY